MEQAFANGSKEKYVLAGAGFISKVNSFAQAKLQTVRQDTVYGLKINKYESPHGTLNIIKHSLLKGNPFGNYGVVVDFDAITYRYVNGRDTQLLTNRQNNDVDGIKEEYLSEVGLQIEQEQRHALMSVDSL